MRFFTTLLFVLGLIHNIALAKQKKTSRPTKRIVEVVDQPVVNENTDRKTSETRPSDFSDVHPAKEYTTSEGFSSAQNRNKNSMGVLTGFGSTGFTTQNSDYFINCSLELNINYDANFQYGVVFRGGGAILAEQLTHDASKYYAAYHLFNNPLVKNGFDSVEVFGRTFVGNSFALTYGLGLSTKRTQWDFNSGSGWSQSTGHISVASKQLNARLDLGNTWNWDNGFTMGCDWIGLVYPIQTTAKVSNSNTPILPEDTVLIDRVKSQHDLLSLSLLNFRMGYSF